ncbi:uncharacterized protein LOC123008954 isoform X2 [Tribolium madens]|uniref:uncharacterized protein LOC123008954 isoform X2 n=1 Tax=Tribolium madens TaxID=41895 RepID=UPI001CF738A8|nr:uncharacterized protein LOC123008954 isoform X2 [Tribolium madens]
MKTACLTFLLLGICSTVMGMALIDDGTGASDIGSRVRSFLIREYVNGLKNLPKNIFDSLSVNAKKLEEVMENKVVKPLAGQIRDFVNGPQESLTKSLNAGGATVSGKPEADGKSTLSI